MKDKKNLTVIIVAVAAIIVSLMLLRSSEAFKVAPQTLPNDHLRLEVEETYCKHMHPTDYHKCLKKAKAMRQPLYVPMYTYVETEDVFGSPDRSGLASFFPHEPSKPFSFPLNKVQHDNIVLQCVSNAPNATVEEIEACVQQKTDALNYNQEISEVVVEPYNGLVANMMPQGLAEDVEGQVAYDNMYTHAQQVNPWTAPIKLD